MSGIVLIPFTTVWRLTFVQEVIHANVPSQSIIASVLPPNGRCSNTLLATERATGYLYVRHRVVDYAVQL